MEQVKKDIDLAQELIFNGGRNIKTNNYSKLYLNTTENIKDYMHFFNDNFQNALLPTASGDHILEAVLNDITDITCYDINFLAKYIAQLKIGAIKKLPKEDFLNFFYNDFFNKDIFEYFQDELDEKTRYFWKYLIDNQINIYSIKRILNEVSILKPNNQIINGLKFYEYSVNNFTRYLENNNYKIIQNNLKYTKIKYIDSDLLDLPPKLENNFDMINLTNIFDKVNGIVFDDASEKFANTVRELIKKLNPEGKIMLNYYYEMGIKDYNKYKDKSMFYARYLKEIMINKRILALLHMRYSFIPYISLPDIRGRQQAHDKLNEFREFQFLRYLKDLNIEPIEIPRSYVATRYQMKSDTDMVLIYKK